MLEEIRIINADRGDMVWLKICHVHALFSKSCRERLNHLSYNALRTGTIMDFPRLALATLNRDVEKTSNSHSHVHGPGYTQ